MFSRVEHVDRVAKVEDALDLLHKIDFEFLASEPLARRLEAIAVNLHVAEMFIAAGSDFSITSRHRDRRLRWPSIPIPS